MKYILQIIEISLICSSCSILHRQEPFELERISNNIFDDKNDVGIYIEIMKFPAKVN